MHRYLVCDLADRRVRLAWLSLQPNGNISFGLNDRTFITPENNITIPIWNAYNRVKTKYLIASTPEALDCVNNPHFTYHPPGYLHLTDQKGKRLFRAIMRLDVALDQESGLIPWIRAISRPLDQLQRAGARSGQDALDIAFHPLGEWLSACIALDFCHPKGEEIWEHASRIHIPWQSVGLRITVSFTYPQIQTMSWRHSY